ncbi:MAG TPA: hypothetical protein VIL78_19845 [Hanamia sp.]
MKKYILGIIAVLMIVAVSSFVFANNNTTNIKNTSLYWYEVTYDATHLNGYIPSADDFYVQSEKNQVSSPCDAGVDKDCLRGFTSAITTFPSMATGTDQIKRPN